MDNSDIKKMIISSLNADTDTFGYPEKLQKSGVSYNFSKNFGDKIVSRLFTVGLKVNKQVEFVRYMDFAFYRIAITGVAAIVALLISIFMMEGTLSFNSLLGLSDNESIVCLLTGK
jgi:hypothetical protein